MKLLSRRLFALFTAALLAAPAARAADEDVIVYAAASLTDVLQAIARQYALHPERFAIINIWRPRVAQPALPGSSLPI